ncbi:MAG: sugar phosphate isomerase/epimerase [Chitinophagales bacterium]|jgi:sugar phosphate isomerase/epimerase
MPTLAVQTYTVRKHLKSPAAIETTFARLKELGVSAVELARIKFEPAEIAAVARACQSNDMQVGSSQITLDYLSKNFDWVVDFHRQLNCTNVAVSVLPVALIIGGVEKWYDFAKQLDELGAKYAESGLNLLFHHHDFEFRKYDGKLGLDILLANTSPENLGLVIDTYWTQRGGRSPENMIIDYADRVKVVHLRDFMIRWKYFDLLPQDCELGQGNLDIKRIVQSCIDAKVEFMAIEQTSSKPFDSIATSVKHLHTLGFAESF